MSKIEVEINLEELSIKNLYYLQGMLKGRKNRRKVNEYTCYIFNRIRKKWGDLSEEQFDALEILLELRKKANKFNQRDGWWLKDRSPLSHEENPINNTGLKIVVINDAVKIVKYDEFVPETEYFLEFADHEKYKGNVEYFAKTYEEDILKAAIFLKARKK